MNRRMAYYGTLPVDLDINQNAQFAMIAHGFMAEAVASTGSWAYGLAGTQTTAASLTINIGRGALGQMAVVDQTNPGTSTILDSTDALMKVGINLSATQLTFTAPTSSGQSQVFLIQGQMQETDTGSTVLQYWNASNPNVPLAGPGGLGASNNTLRTQTVSISTVAGAPANTGSQTTPSAATGWVPLYTVTLTNGQTTITTAQIVQHPAAPFLPWNLAQLASEFSAIVTASGLTFAKGATPQIFPSLQKLFNVTASYAGSNNGFIAFPGGIYHETCSVMVPGGGGIQQTNITLPTAFPTNCLDASWSYLGNTPPTAQGSIAVQPLSRTQIAVTTNFASTVTLGIAIKAWGN